MNKLKLITLALITVPFLTLGQAIANEGEESSQPAVQQPNNNKTESEDEDSGGYTVVVTAQKRAKSLVDVPIAMSVIGGDSVKDASVTDIFGLDAMVPTLNLTQAANSINTVVSLRGIGTSSFNPGLEPSVGIYVDGVFRAATGTAIGDFLSLDRIEVLRGPQSTLFGKNSSAGVLSFVTKKPEFDSEAVLSATIGNYDQRIVKGTVTGPLSDSVAYRLSANVNKRDGYITNLFDDSDINQRDRSAFRGQLLIEPGDEWSLRLIADYSTFDELCCAAPSFFNGPTAGAIAALGGTVLGSAGEQTNFFDREVSFNGDVHNDMTDKGFSAELNVDYDAFTFTSITAYRTFVTDTSLDADFTDLEIVRRNTGTADSSAFTQEFRFTTTSDGDVGDVDWMFGGFYSNIDLDTTGDVTYGTHTRPYFNILAGGSGLGALFGLPPELENLLVLELITGNAPGSFFAPDTGQVEETFVTNSKSIAAFTQMDWVLTENTSLTAGIRYTKEDKTATGTFDVQDPLAAIDFSTLFGGALGGFAGLQIFPPLQDFDRDRSESEATGNIIISHQLAEDFNIYGSYSRGYKAGGFNVSRAASNNDPNNTSQFEFEPELVNALEFGSKYRFWDGMGLLDIAIYKQDIEDFQTSVFTGIGFELDNAGSITVQGIELDSKFRFSDDFNASFGFSYNDAEFKSFVGGPCTGADPNPQPGPACDLSGKTLPDAPKLTISASSDYFVEMGSLLGFVHGEVYYRGERNVQGALTELSVQDATTMVNASIGIRAEDGESWEVFLWARNLTDEDYLQTVFDSVAQSGSLNAYPNIPRTYGITARILF